MRHCGTVWPLAGPSDVRHPCARELPRGDPNPIQLRTRTAQCASLQQRKPVSVPL